MLPDPNPQQLKSNAPTPTDRQRITILEQAYREQWRNDSFLSLAELTSQLPESIRVEALVRLIQIDLEFEWDRNTKHVSDYSIVMEEDERIGRRLELYMLRHPDLRNHWSALSQLVVLEFALRARSHQPASIAHYQEILPEYASEIELLLERVENNLLLHQSQAAVPTVISKSETTVTQQEVGLSRMWQLPRILGRFYLISELDSGGMGTVFRAIDMRNGGIVAVKLMRRSDAWSVYQFNEEFRTLSRIRHRNLVRLMDAFSEGDLRFFSMELVLGPTLSRWSHEQRNTPGYFDRVRHLAGQLANVINHLHQHHIVHRDVKPANVLVRTRDRITLLDCSLAQDLRFSQNRESSFETGPIGTLSYLAPERTAGDLGGPPSDWFSFGVTLFELLVGHLPNDNFTQSGKIALSQAILNKFPGVPFDLCQLCEALLNPEPQMRPVGSIVLKTLGVDDRRSLAIAGRSKFPLIGRGLLLAQMDQVFRSPSNHLAILHGPTGIGKSTILEHWKGAFLRSSQERLVLHLQCHRHDHLPHRVLNLLVQSIVDSARIQPGSEWINSLKKYASEISIAFPQLAQLPCLSDSLLIETDRSIKRSFDALFGFLSDVSQIIPLVIMIDDMQFGDTFSLEQIDQRLAGSPNFRGVVFGTCENASPESGVPPIANLKHAAWLEVNQLGKEDCVRFLQAACLQPITAKLIERMDLVHYSEGKPWLLNQIAEFLDALPDWHSVDAPSTHDAISDWQQLRLRALDRVSRKLLQYVACAEHPVSQVVLERCLRRQPATIQLSINSLENEGWLVVNDQGNEVSIRLRHESMRPTILKSMSPLRTNRRHLRLAHSMVLQSERPWLLIGQHYLQAGRVRRAAAAFIEATRASLRAKNLREAVWIFDKFESLPQEAQNDHRRIAAELAAALRPVSGQSS